MMAIVAFIGGFLSGLLFTVVRIKLPPSNEFLKKSESDLQIRGGGIIMMKVTYNYFEAGHRKGIPFLDTLAEVRKVINESIIEYDVDRLENKLQE